MQFGREKIGDMLIDYPHSQNTHNLKFVKLKKIKLKIYSTKF